MRRYLNKTRQQRLGADEEGSLGLMGRARSRQASVVGNRVPEEYETQMYDEFGLIMTPEQHGTLQAELERSRKARAEAQAKLNEQQSKIDAMYLEKQKMLDAQRGKIDSEIAKAYGSGDDGLETVRVVSGNNVEATYKLPKEAISKLDTQVFNQGEGSYTANWVDDGKHYNIDTKPAGIDDRYGKELHESLKDAQSQIGLESDHQKAMADKARAAAYGQLGEASKALDNEMSMYRSQIDDSRAAIKAAEAAEQKQLADAKARLEESIGKSRGTALNIGYKGTGR